VARNPQEAMAQVKKDLGPEAVILSTQSRRYPHSEAKISAERRRVEVTAAANQAIALDTFADFQPWDLDSGSSGLSSLDLREELEEIKGLFKQWLGEQGPPPWLAPYQDLTMLFHGLMRAGVHDQIMRRWLEKLRTSLTNGREGNTKNLKEWSLRQLLQEVQVVDLWKLPIKGPRKWTFLGSTGVGKTSTIAKLAIQAAFMRKIQVGLISLDNVRLGGQEHLAAYARVSGLPLVAAQTQSELAEALEKMGNLDLLLIDTPGRNPRDPALPLGLRQFFAELPGLEHHLVVSATAAEANLADAFQGFSGMPLASCLVTKVDEGRDIVGVFNQLYKRGIAISYLTTGQRVPEDLELATHRRLAGLLLKPHYRQRFQR
jgi:flagellar biosynthesis protein FlhF